MKLPKTERFTDDCKSCGWCPEKENSTVPLGDCGLCFNCMEKFIKTAVERIDSHGCLTGDCPHEDVNDCVYAMGELVSEQAALMKARGGRIRIQNQMLAAKDRALITAEIALEEIVRLAAKVSPPDVVADPASRLGLAGMTAFTSLSQMQRREDGDEPR